MSQPASRQLRTVPMSLTSTAFSREHSRESGAESVRNLFFSFLLSSWS